MQDNTDIINAALETVGTPWHWQGRKVGVGMDCIGVLVHAATSCDCVCNDYTKYSHHMKGQGVLVKLMASLDEIPVEEACYGDVLVFRVKSALQHTGIYIWENTMVHAMAKVGVRKTRISQSWQKRLYKKAYRFRREERWHQ